MLQKLKNKVSFFALAFAIILLPAISHASGTVSVDSIVGEVESSFTSLFASLGGMITTFLPFGLAIAGGLIAFRFGKKIFKQFIS